jgi:tetratricopeptide (TPR) repeat protein
LKGLGWIYEVVGKETDAEECFRQAINLGKEMGLANHELVRLYYWLGNAPLWQSKYDEMIQVGEEGLALLVDEAESTEAALMNDTVALGYSNKGNREKSRDFFYRNVQFLDRLPYSEELRRPYVMVSSFHVWYEKNVDESEKWLQILEQKAQHPHDLRLLGDVYHNIGLNVSSSRGDLHGIILHEQQAVELFTKIGDASIRCDCLRDMERAFLSLGDLQKAEECAHRKLEILEGIGHKREIARSYIVLGTISLCRGSLGKATDAFQKALQLYREIGNANTVAWATRSLGQAYWAAGERQKGLSQFQEALALLKTHPVALAITSSGPEEAYDDPAAFRAFCHRFREEHPEVNESPFVQWYLEPAECGLQNAERGLEEYFESPPSDWAWRDEFNDCSYTVGDGLEIRAANGRDLRDINLSAPRLLRPASGDFAAQTVVTSPPAPLLETGEGSKTPSPLAGEGRGEGNPSIGGLLLWKDKQNYLRLDRGARGKYEINFSGCISNKDLIIGRGRLVAERVFLRLERIGNRVNALCSADGKAWFTVGQVEFPVDDPVEVGLHAIGMIDRTIYHGAFPEGTAIRFEGFEIYGDERRRVAQSL